MLCIPGLTRQRCPQASALPPLPCTEVRLLSPQNQMADGRFLVFRRAILGSSVFAHVAPSRTLYGRSSKALSRFRDDLVACMRGVRGQPFSTPLYIQTSRGSPPSASFHCYGAP